MRRAAAAGPAPPVDRIIAPLDDPDAGVAASAAANPALPVPVMWSLLGVRAPPARTPGSPDRPGGQGSGMNAAASSVATVQPRLR
ncbi:hypothetical protein J2S44_000434 [Catenuloplanes niger]|uniref:Uncharacterized protein n=1 Tax=Catenuloplanes niger TaxID=587534 RepID=A0AAE3ZK84_9ACTN|nr:hypothetical protein [Catenuloplanes niger]